MAKEEKQEPTAAPAPDAPESLGPPKSYRLQIALGLVGLILFQLIVLYILSPRQPPPEYRGGIDPRNGPRIFNSFANEPPTILSTEGMVEKPIKEGPFKFKSPRDDVNESFSIVMHVTVRKKEESRFTKRYEECKNEIINDVTIVLQISTPEERGEPGYTTIREKAKKAINNVLRTPFVQQVLVSDVSYEAN